MSRSKSISVAAEASNVAKGGFWAGVWAWASPKNSRCPRISVVECLAALIYLLPPSGNLTRISHHLTVEARHRPAITALRLLAVLNVLFKYAPHYSRNAAPSGTRLVLTGLSRTSPRHLVRKAAKYIVRPWLEVDNQPARKPKANRRPAAERRTSLNNRSPAV